MSKRISISANQGIQGLMNKPKGGNHKNMTFELVMPSCNTNNMSVFLKELSKRYDEDLVVLACDGAAWHKSKNLEISGNIIMTHIPPYVPEMNPIEQIWKQVRQMGVRQ